MPNDTMGGQIKTALMKPEGGKQGHHSGSGDLLAADAAQPTVGQTGCGRMSDDTTALVLAPATENAELRAALAKAQELLIENAMDAGEMHARVEELQAELAAALTERDAWRADAERPLGPMLRSG